MTLNPGDFSINTCSKSSTTGNQYSTVLTGSDVETFQNNALESIVNIMRNVSNPTYEIPETYYLGYVPEAPGTYQIVFNNDGPDFPRDSFIIDIDVSAGTYTATVFGETPVLGNLPTATTSGDNFFFDDSFGGKYFVEWDGFNIKPRIDFESFEIATVRKLDFDYREPLLDYNNFISDFQNNANLIYNNAVGIPHINYVTNFYAQEQTILSVSPLDPLPVHGTSGFIDSNLEVGSSTSMGGPLNAAIGTIELNIGGYQTEYIDNDNIIYAPGQTIQPTKTQFYDVLRGAPSTGPGPEITNPSQLRYLEYIACELFGPLRNAAKAIASASTSAVCDDTEENGRYQVCVSNCLFTMNIVVQ